ncbi:hypothetical protein YK48G_21960 [Lentilactobacillus fungorum]|uniref:Uncharacterized protein n=1 Tax=Lentilactobacillus fungorum TaxID=2201250 RepID=A0ABQ3W3G7_9LACO|nr:hypothetical protein [Lentilactobacillus fungorum]GHP14771.1 hypothetical protein YK48G_21960 [Lentilactobacillus fungorum]
MSQTFGYIRHKSAINFKPYFQLSIANSRSFAVSLLSFYVDYPSFIKGIDFTQLIFKTTVATIILFLGMLGSEFAVRKDLNSFQMCAATFLNGIAFFALFGIWQHLTGDPSNIIGINHTPLLIAAFVALTSAVICGALSVVISDK